MPPLDVDDGVVALTTQLCNIRSVSGDEGPLADDVEQTLRAQASWEVLRFGNTVVARTRLGREQRVVLAGHLDTVPVAQNLPVRVEGDDETGVLHGRGTVDMKGGVAVMLRLAAALDEPRHDVTLVFYDCEEVEATRNGLGLLVAEHPDWVAGDVAVLLEPTDGRLEGGCNGTMRIDVLVAGAAAHSARAWRGVNAIHQAAPVLALLADYEPRAVEVDGLVYREGLNAVGIRGGIAGNVIPDRCVVTVNYRFAPDKDEAAALAHLREVFAGYEIEVTDTSPGARPGLHHPAVHELVVVADEPVGPKYGWTDVARFTALGVPAINYGPGNPELAHRDDESLPVDQLHRCESVLARWLGSPG
ncbi:MAG: succinyl-diaminopimelate desuccinylase [Jiangellales bacterium]